jgi:integrase
MRGQWFHFSLTVRHRRKDISLRTKDRREAERIVQREYVPLIMSKNVEILGAFIRAAKFESERDKIKMLDAWSLYLKNPNRPDSSEGTLGNYERILRRFIEAHPNLKFLDDVSDKMVIAYSQTLTGLSAATFNYHTGFLSLLFRTILPHAINPFLAAKRRERTSQRHKALSDSEIESLLQNAEHFELKRLLELGAFTGLRLCDAMGLKSENIREGCIVLVPQKTRKQSGMEVKIPIHNRLGWLRSAEGHVFPELLKLHKDTVSKMIIDAFRKTGFQTSVEGSGVRKVCQYGFHSLRHSFISRLINKGANPMMVQSMAGHSSSKMTAHYYHSNEEALRNAIDRL